MIRWSLSNSISVIVGALVLTTVKVTGPAGTLPVSSAQPSFPPLLAMVTLTALVAAGFAGLELPFEWPHAVADNTVTAAKAIAAEQNSRDRHLARTLRFALNRFLSCSARGSPRTAIMALRPQANAKPASTSGSHTFHSCPSARFRSLAAIRAAADRSSALGVDQSVGSPPTLTVLAAVSPPPVRTAVRLLAAWALTTRSAWASTVYAVVVAQRAWNGPGVRATETPTGSLPPVMLTSWSSVTVGAPSSSAATVACHTRTRTPSTV